MCGHHHDHQHHRATTPVAGTSGPIGARLRSRRAFLGDFGRGTLAMAVLAPVVAACSSRAETGQTTAEAGAAEAGAADSLVWARADLGFVSAYVLARGNRAAIVDTGVAGSADAIGATLSSIGLTYDDVEHVILTHHHADHAGSIAEITARATSAAVYAGQADLDAIDAERIVALVGGEDVFGLEMLATPGHTAGHVSVIDHTSGLLVAGDAVFAEAGRAIEGPAQFFEDIPGSRDTIRQLAQLSFNTLLVGHGDPIEGGADAAVAELAASLP